jgi:carboxymethylenebutenolidase
MAPVSRLVLHAGPEPVAAAHAWGRIEAFFAEHLGGGDRGDGPAPGVTPS